MEQPGLSPEDEELLNAGLLAINQAHVEGKITLKEWVRISREWANRVLRDRDEMFSGDLPGDCLDS
jgi:hypothetical protein